MKMDNIAFAKSGSGKSFDIYATFGDRDAVRVGLMMRTKTCSWSFYARASEFRIEDPNLAKSMVMAAWEASKAVS